MVSAGGSWRSTRRPGWPRLLSGLLCACTYAPCCTIGTPLRGSWACAHRPGTSMPLLTKSLRPTLERRPGPPRPPPPLPLLTPRRPTTCGSSGSSRRSLAVQAKVGAQGRRSRRVFGRSRGGGRAGGPPAFNGRVERPFSHVLSAAPVARACARCPKRAAQPPRRERGARPLEWAAEAAQTLFLSATAGYRGQIMSLDRTGESFSRDDRSFDDRKSRNVSLAIYMRSKVSEIGGSGGGLRGNGSLLLPRRYT